MSKGCSFREEWLDPEMHPDISLWIQKCRNIKSASCRICPKIFDISNMGISAVRSHAKSKKHKDLIKIIGNNPNSISNFQSPKNISSNEGTSEFSGTINNEKKAHQNSASNKQTTFLDYCTTDDVTKAEILRTLHKVSTQTSSRTAEQSTDLFPLMFPDSIIEKKCNCIEIN